MEKEFLHSLFISKHICISLSCPDPIFPVRTPAGSGQDKCLGGGSTPHHGLGQNNSCHMEDTCIERVGCENYDFII